jgi:hypothetical protein
MGEEQANTTAMTASKRVMLIRDQTACKVPAAFIVAAYEYFRGEAQWHYECGADPSRVSAGEPGARIRSLANVAQA